MRRIISAAKGRKYRISPQSLLFSSYPKHEIVNMPALSPTMTSGTLSTWKKNVGDKCVPGDTIAEIETDKASMAFEGQDEFYIAKHLVAAGSEVTVGSPILVSVEDESLIASFANFTVVASPAPTAAAPEPPKQPVNTPPIPVIASSSAPVPAPPAVATLPTTPAATYIPTPVAAAPHVPSPPAPIGTQFAEVHYSVRVNASAASASPLEAKLKSLQNAYNIKYGRGTPESATPSKKTK